MSYLVDHSAQKQQAISSAPKLAFYNGLTLVQLPCASVSICNMGFTFQVCECLAISSLSWDGSLSSGVGWIAGEGWWKFLQPLVQLEWSYPFFPSIDPFMCPPLFHL